MYIKINEEVREIHTHLSDEGSSNVGEVWLRSQPVMNVPEFRGNPIDISGTPLSS